MSDLDLTPEAVERLAAGLDLARKVMFDIGTFETGQVICKEAAATLRALSARLAVLEASETATIQWLQELKPKVQRIEAERDAAEAALATLTDLYDKAAFERDALSVQLAEVEAEKLTLAQQFDKYHPDPALMARIILKGHEHEVRAEAVEAALATAQADAALIAELVKAGNVMANALRGDYIVPGSAGKWFAARAKLNGGA